MGGGNRGIRRGGAAEACWILIPIADCYWCYLLPYYQTTVIIITNPLRTSLALFSSGTDHADQKLNNTYRDRQTDTKCHGSRLYYACCSSAWCPFSGPPSCGARESSCRSRGTSVVSGTTGVWPPCSCILTYCCIYSSANVHIRRAVRRQDLYRLRIHLVQCPE